MKREMEHVISMLREAIAKDLPANKEPTKK
jgi:hypothetical protein